jgi:predicted DNA-binding transcriptional regulator AlpA
VKPSSNEIPPPAPAPDSPPAGPDRLLVSARDAARLCGLSVATWHRRAAAGLVPAAVRIGPGCVRWRVEELREWIGAACPPRATWEALQAAQRNGRPRCGP